MGRATFKLIRWIHAFKSAKKELALFLGRITVYALEVRTEQT